MSEFLFSLDRIESHNTVRAVYIKYSCVYSMYRQRQTTTHSTHQTQKKKENNNKKKQKYGKERAMSESSSVSNLVADRWPLGTRLLI